jgi:hypothetical protein
LLGGSRPAKGGKKTKIKGPISPNKKGGPR